MDAITLALLAWIGCMVAVITLFACLRRYETVLFLLLVSPWFSMVFLLNSKEEVDQSGPGAYIRIALLLLLGCAGVITFVREQARDGTRVALHLRLLGAFILLSLLSTTYSIDPLYTFVRAVSFLAVFIVLLGFSKWLKGKRSFDRAMNVLFYSAGFFVLLNLLSMALLPGEVWFQEVWFQNESVSRFQGLATQPNELGGFFMIAYPIFAWKYKRGPFLKKLGIMALMLGVIVMHVLTGSRGSMGGAMFGAVVWLLARRDISQLVVFATVMAALVSIVALVKPASFQREGGAYTNVTDLTGRDEFWYGAMTLIKERPLLGYGYSVQGKVWADPRFNIPEYSLWRGSAKTSLHSGYITIAVGGGVPMLLLWCAILAIPLWRCLKLPYSDYKGFVVSVMAMLLLVNFVESTIIGATPIGSVMFFLTWLMAGRLAELVPAHHEAAVQFRTDRPAVRAA